MKAKSGKQNEENGIDWYDDDQDIGIVVEVTCGTVSPSAFLGVVESSWMRGSCLVSKSLGLLAQPPMMFEELWDE